MDTNETINNQCSFNGIFDIKSRTEELLSSGAARGIFSQCICYHIPIYQRPYSWGEPQLRRLLEDLKEGVVNDEPMFLGTMQLSAPRPQEPGDASSGVAFDIIDGQQRTTTLMLLRCLLEERLGKTPVDDGREKNYFTHVNRGAAQRDLDEFWTVWNKKELSTCKLDSDNTNPYLANIAILNNLLDDYFLNVEDEESNIGLNGLLNFIEHNLRFVVIETHAGISKTLKIFNTINTTGLDLGSDDLFKIRFYEYRKDIRQDKDDVFDKISAVYQRITEAQRDRTGGMYYSMGDVLDVYKRILIAKHNLQGGLDTFATPRFFEGLFDTLLHVRTWKEFKNADVDMQIEDLDAIVDAFETVSKAFKENEHLRIMHHFLWETRYGHAWNLLVAALYFKAITPNEMLDFDTLLFKLLVPSSLYWAKRVYAVQGKLMEILHKLPEHQGKGIELLKGYLLKGLDKDGLDPQELFKQACMFQISGYAKWKNLICRLCEYLLAQDENKLQSFDHLFCTGIDIEHIQSYTDSKDRERVWQNWGEELNRLGNLVMFESSRNRSVGNDASKKPVEYAASVYTSVNNLKNEVANWSLEKAVERREKLTKRMQAFLFTA